MVYCIVKDCHNRTYVKSAAQLVIEAKEKISFHKLPANPKKRRAWIKILNLDEFRLPKCCFVCSCHFKKEDLDRTTFSVRLMPHAVPYVNQEDSQAVNAENPTKAEDPEEFEDNPSDRCLAGCPGWKGKIDDDSPPGIKADTDKMDLDTGGMFRREQTPPPPGICSSSDKATQVSPERIFNSPAKQALRAQLAMQKNLHRQQVRVLKQKYRRCLVKLDSVKSVLEELQAKNLMWEEHQRCGRVPCKTRI